MPLERFSQALVEYIFGVRLMCGLVTSHNNNIISENKNQRKLYYSWNIIILYIHLTTTDAINVFQRAALDDV